MATTSVESMRKEVPGWGIWPLWVAACATGNAVGALAFSDWGPRAAPDAGVVSQALAYWPILVAATFPGFLQWAIFRRWFPGAGWWVVATGVGSFLGFMTYMWMGAAADTGGEVAQRVEVPAIIALGGAVLGAVEWLVLRRWSAGSGWWVFLCWVLARSLSWFGATWVFLGLSGFRDDPHASLLLAGIASGALSGAITGAALVGLLRHARVNQTSASAVPAPA